MFRSLVEEMHHLRCDDVSMDEHMSSGAGTNPDPPVTGEVGICRYSVLWYQNASEFWYPLLPHSRMCTQNVNNGALSVLTFKIPAGVVHTVL